MDVTIRRARPEEARGLSDVALRSKAHWGYDPGFLERAERELTVRAIDLALGRTFVAERDGAVVGFYGLEYEAPELGLAYMFAEPRHIGSGVGAALMAHATAEAKRHGATTLRIESDPNAEAFYLRMGAKRVGEVPSGTEPGRLLPLLQLVL